MIELFQSLIRHAIFYGQMVFEALLQCSGLRNLSIVVDRCLQFFYSLFTALRIIPYISRKYLNEIAHKGSMRIDHSSSQIREDLRDGFQTEGGIALVNGDIAKFLGILIGKLEMALTKFSQFVIIRIEEQSRPDIIDNLQVRLSVNLIIDFLDTIQPVFAEKITKGGSNWTAGYIGILEIVEKIRCYASFIIGIFTLTGEFLGNIGKVEVSLTLPIKQRLDLRALIVVERSHFCIRWRLNLDSVDERQHTELLKERMGNGALRLFRFKDTMADQSLL